MIHTCGKREWYVDNFLIPSMKAQGIKSSDIHEYVDRDHQGNLKACLDSFSRLPKDGATWHLQDDVLISRNFKKMTEEAPNGIVAGFCSSYDNKELVRYVRYEHLWYSFPCIKIPNEIAHKFVEWYNTSAVNNKRYTAWINQNKYDDSLFREFLLNSTQTVTAYNMVPNVIQHVDYLIGGSLLNERRSKEASAIYWDEKDLEIELSKSIENYRKNITLQT